MPPVIASIGHRVSSRRLALLWVVLLVTACANAGSSTPSPRPSASSSRGPVGAIDHPTGPTDVVLRFEEGGGFVPVSFLATQAPPFTLYGDGTVVFRNSTEAPVDKGDGVNRNAPFRIARLSEDQIQELLDRAINRGALGIARAKYDPGTIADAPTATFTLNAGGVKKTVSVVALGMDPAPTQDVVTLKALASLGDLLRNFDPNGSSGAGIYRPERYRGILSDAGVPEAKARPWPWPTLTPSSFATPAHSPGGFAQRVMSAAEIEALGLADIEGGLQALALDRNGKTYLFDLRPLLPDETS